MWIYNLYIYIIFVSPLQWLLGNFEITAAGNCKQKTKLYFMEVMRRQREKDTAGGKKDKHTNDFSAWASPAQVQLVESHSSSCFVMSQLLVSYRRDFLQWADNLQGLFFWIFYSTHWKPYISIVQKIRRPVHAWLIYLFSSQYYYFYKYSYNSLKLSFPL